MTLLCGVESPVGEPWQPFDPRVVEFLGSLSAHIRALRPGEEIGAFGFWCRPAHLEALRERHTCPLPRLGRGHIFHVAPSNVPTMFGYSLAIGLLAGNVNTVRLSKRHGPVEKTLCALLEEVLKKPEFAGIKQRISVITYPRKEEITAEYMEQCDGRVVWGGDETVRAIRALPMRAGGVELCFPDRWSMALLSQKAVWEAEQESLAELVHRFYKDTYAMDQQGCSSPKLVLWLEDGGEPSARKRWWQALGREAAEHYEWNAWKATRKKEAMCRWAMGWPGEAEVERYEGNLLYVVRPQALPRDITTLPGGFGLFFEGSIPSLEKLVPLLRPKVQTLVCLGQVPGEVARFLADRHAAGVDRVVLPGQALEMDTIWDGKDLIGGLSRMIG